MAAGGLKATEMNVGRSVAEWNPVSIVARLAKGFVQPYSPALCVRSGCQALEQMVGLRTWCNGSGTQDEMNEVGRRTQVAARTKAVGVARSVTNCVVQRSTRRAMQVQQYHKRFINCFIAAAALVWRICLPNRHEEHRFTLQRGHC